MPLHPALSRLRYELCICLSLSLLFVVVSCYRFGLVCVWYSKYVTGRQYSTGLVFTGVDWVHPIINNILNEVPTITLSSCSGCI